MPNLYGVSNFFLRPGDTNAYASGDLVANSTSAGSVLPLKFESNTSELPQGSFAPGYIPAIRLHKSTATLTNALFRVHLYRDLPTFTSSGDNGVFSTVVATGNLFWRCSYDIQFIQATADGASGLAVPTDGVIIPQIFDPSGSPIYALIEARAAYSPGNAERFDVRLLMERP